MASTTSTDRAAHIGRATAPRPTGPPAGPLSRPALALAPLTALSATAAIIEAAPAAGSGITAAVFNVSRQVGSAVGVALFGTFATVSADFITGLRLSAAVATGTLPALAMRRRTARDGTQPLGTGTL
ncbi:hypothetical protein [Streptomyces sp. WAC01526]|uniref:hypothetical protein n=1 Tax=Streptomyces sp. WAC01526 TaxID=2588709 RepID=UPI001651ED1A|nr:hypothetical protein [Streptomyces sp. WAC01526]